MAQYFGMTLIQKYWLAPTLVLNTNTLVFLASLGFNTKVLLKVVLFREGLVPSIEPLKKYWGSKAMVLGYWRTKECSTMQEEVLQYPNTMAVDPQCF
jgi:hypothetical protein